MTFGEIGTGFSCAFSIYKEMNFSIQCTFALLVIMHDPLFHFMLMLREIVQNHKIKLNSGTMRKFMYGIMYTIRCYCKDTNLIKMMYQLQAIFPNVIHKKLSRLPKIWEFVSIL